ncbi:MAG: hypothetical protein HQ575_03970 [Candidatus Omnitrophica bacterium]|nr:hypothetical protein [Candidatus Omnitrophota bacterium]
MQRRQKINIEILKLPNASRLDEFDALANDKDITLRFINAREEIGSPELFIIPGTSKTIQDYIYLKRTGYSDKIRELAKKKVAIMGISGGFQMLGAKIIDIKGSEMLHSRCEGFSFLSMVTRLMPSKVEDDVEAMLLKNNCKVHGYESHIGRTKYLNGLEPMFTITKRGGIDVEIPDGAVNEDGKIFGTYIHGLFINTKFKDTFLSKLQ